MDEGAGDAPRRATDGVWMAVAAYLIWGLLPLYIRLVAVVPPFEFIGWRTLFTMPVCIAIVLARRQGAEVWRALTTPRLLALLTLSALLIGSNWLIYVTAIDSGQIFASSLGYYINPLLNVVIGWLWLGEPLNGPQKAALALAGLGVAMLAAAGLGGSADAGVVLAIALSQAATFAGYALVRRYVPVGALPGLTVETILLAVPAVLILGAAQQHGPLHFGHEIALSLLIACAGVITAVPLLLFTAAARRIRFSILGFIQFIAPTAVFLQGVFVFHRSLAKVQVGCFVLIWLATAMFCWDLGLRHRRERAAIALRLD